MAFVLDSSVTLSWLLPDEGEACDAVADRLETEAAVAPAIWPLEVGNALLVARRRNRLTDRDLDRLLAVMSALPVEVETGMAESTLPAVMDLARTLGLTSYDAAYLELARRRAIPLATIDHRLRAACETLGVARLP
jgi:predicted nucleic acid-binding protein